MRETRSSTYTKRRERKERRGEMNWPDGRALDPQVNYSECGRRVLWIAQCICANVHLRTAEYKKKSTWYYYLASARLSLQKSHCYARKFDAIEITS